MRIMQTREPMRSAPFVPALAIAIGLHATAPSRSATAAPAKRRCTRWRNSVASSAARSRRRAGRVVPLIMRSSVREEDKQ